MSPVMCRQAMQTRDVHHATVGRLLLVGLTVRLNVSLESCMP